MHQSLDLRNEMSPLMHPFFLSLSITFTRTLCRVHLTIPAETDFMNIGYHCLQNKQISRFIGTPTLLVWILRFTYTQHTHTNRF